MALSPGSLRATLGWAGHGGEQHGGSEGQNSLSHAAHNILSKPLLTTAWDFECSSQPLSGCGEQLNARG